MLGQVHKAIREARTPHAADANGTSTHMTHASTPVSSISRRSPHHIAAGLLTSGPHVALSDTASTSVEQLHQMSYLPAGDRLQ